LAKSKKELQNALKDKAKAEKEARNKDKKLDYVERDCQSFKDKYESLRENA